MKIIEIVRKHAPEVTPDQDIDAALAAFMSELEKR